MGKVIISGACPLMTAPKAGTPLSTYTEGSIIKINENGSPVEFYVAKHDYEAGLNGTGRTLVVRKDCFGSREWNDTSVNTYATSAINGWLNGDYKNLFSTSISNAIGVTKFKYTPGNDNNSIVTLEKAVFLLSVTELGKTAHYANIEGIALPIASSLQIAYLNSSTVIQWTRSPDTGGTGHAFYLNTDGSAYSNSCTNFYYSRPAFTLPSTIKIDANGQVIE